MDVVMKEQLVAAGMPAAQADVLASHMPEWPDWSQLATKADLQELAGQMATKADLKELELNLQGQMLDLKTDLGGQMLDLKTDLGGQMLDLKTDLGGQMLALQGQMLDLQGQMLETKTDLTGQMLGIKSGLNWRLWLPVATSVATAFAAVAAIYVALTLSQFSNLP